MAEISAGAEAGRMARLRFLPRTADGRSVTESLREAFEEYGSPLYRLCVLLLGRREGAEDLMQESFVRLAPKISSLREEIVWPYLRRIAVNLANDRFRKAALDLRVRRAETVQVDHPDLGVAHEVWEAVRRLPSRQRACVVLRYYEDMTERQIAETLGCSPGTVKSSTSRALDRLRKELGDEA
jgi:RNA polymerase sigma-70 factor (sigma-E family)